MDRSIEKRTQEISKKRVRKRLWRRIVSALSVIVVFVTTYALILPAITMENPTVCGLKEHSHTDKCYEEHRYLSCGIEEAESHTHEESCYDDEGNLICLKEETEGHKHDDSCYSIERILICELEEHIHSELCYPEEDRETETIEEPDKETENEARDNVETLEEPVKEDELKLKARTDDITVTLTAPLGAFGDSEEGLTLEVNTIKNREAEELIESELKGSEGRGTKRETVLFDIRVMRGAEEVQPVKAVSVTFSGIETPKDDAKVFHVDVDKKRAEDLETTTEKNGDISVETDHFSIYGVSFTVDFHYGDYDYSILGKDEISISELFSGLNIKREEGDIADIKFSAPELVSVKKTTGGWKLQSLKAFNTEETLTITFSDGSELVIDVTDAPAGGVGENYVANTGEVTAVNCTMTTGTAPWDADNAPGNDSDSTNAVVRSFDTIFYNVGYTLNLTNKYQGVFSGYRKGNLYVEATLPLPKEQATFDLSGVPWLTNASVTDNGASQTLTGYYAMDAGDGDYAIPATGTLKLAVSVKGMPSGSAVQPTIRLWLDEPNAKSVTPGIVTVSAAAHYNVSIRPITIAKNVKLDTTTGQIGSGTVGQLVDCGVYVSAVSNNSAKGLRGIYVDLQSVSFYVQPHFYKDGTLLSSYASNQPNLWEYTLITNSNTGLQGRELSTPFSSVDANTASGRNRLPYSERSLGNEQNAVYQSGNMTATKVSGQGIKIDFNGISSDHRFPKNSATMASGFGSSEAVLATGVVQVFYPTGELTDEGKYTSYCDIADIITVNGTSVMDYDTDKTETGTSDNRARLFYNDVPEGDFIQAIGIGTINSSSAAFERGTPFVSSVWHQSVYNSELYCVDFFIKFTDGISPDPAGAHFPKSSLVSGNTNDVDLNIKTLYVAKANGTAWTNREEMLTTNMHESGGLRVYTTLSALEATGATCIGVWLEIRNPSGVPVLQDVNDNIVFLPWITMHIKESAPIDSVQELMLESRSYATNITTSRETSTVLPRATNYIHNYSDGTQIPNYHAYTDRVGFFKHVLANFNQHYDVSQVGTTMQMYYLPGYVVNERDVYREAFSGNTIKVIGEAAKITKSVAQIQNSAPRSSYFIDNGERSVDYVLSPRVMANASGVPTSGTAKTEVTVTDTLPAGLSYVPGSAVLGGTYNQPADRKSHGTVTGGTPLMDNGTVSGAPVCTTTTGDVTMTVTPKSDGTKELKWVLTNVQVGKDMPKIYYSARIGNAEDPLHDVRDGDSLTNTVNIFSTNSRKIFSGAYGNLATSTINVFRMENATLQKNIITPEIDVNKPVSYTITYINNSSVIIPSLSIIDLLPYNGDLRGSSFHGGYTMGEVKVERLNEAAGQYALDYTTDTSVHGHEGDVYASGFNPPYTAATATVSGNTTTMTFPTNTVPTLLKFKGTNVGAYAKIKITITLNLTGNEDGDKYYNDASYNAPSIPAPVYTVPVNSQVVQTTANLSISKTVVGGGTGSFPFKVNLKNAVGNPVIIPADTASPATYTVNTVTGEVTFSLNHGESVTLKAIPRGTTATVRETSHAGYTVIIKDGGGTVLANGDSADISVNADKTVSVINNAGVELPSTGGYGKSAYMLIGLILCIASIAIYIKEARKREEG